MSLQKLHIKTWPKCSLPLQEPSDHSILLLTEDQDPDEQLAAPRVHCNKQIIAHQTLVILPKDYIHKNAACALNDKVKDPEVK